MSPRVRSGSDGLKAWRPGISFGLILLMILGLVSLICAGCETGRSQASRTTQPVQAGGPQAGPTDTAGAPPKIEFFDMSSFDSKLSAAMKKNPSLIAVTFPVSVTVNSIPKRLDKWFSVIEKSEGTVKLKADEEAAPPGMKKRGALSLLVSLAVGVYNLVREESTYGPAKNYNALVHYNKATGKIRQIDFTRK